MRGRRLLILHLSTAAEAGLLRQDKPAWVTAEVTPQHLLMTVDDYDRIGTLAQMNPPLRTAHDNEVLWQAPLDGVIDWSPFEGWELAGWPVVTIVGGQVVYDHGKINPAVRLPPLRFDAP